MVVRKDAPDPPEQKRKADRLPEALQKITWQERRLRMIEKRNGLRNE